MDYGDEDRMNQRSGFSGLQLSWPMLLLAGWLLYEFTAEPGLAALVACAKFGWADVRTAFWLRRVDPNRRRGQTCFWAYLTYGLWKVALLATVIMIVLGFIGSALDLARRRPGPNHDLAQAIGGVLVAAAVGFGLSFPTTFIALWSARRNRVRIWLGEAPSRARKERFWPPSHGALNAASFVYATCLVLTFWLLIPAAMFLMAAIQPIGLDMIVCGLMMMAALVLAILALFRSAMRSIADSPQECWGTEEAEAAYQDESVEEGVSEA
jgi:hypothetical protein